MSSFCKCVFFYSFLLSFLLLSHIVIFFYFVFDANTYKIHTFQIDAYYDIILSGPHLHARRTQTRAISDYKEIIPFDCLLFMQTMCG